MQAIKQIKANKVKYSNKVGYHCSLLQCTICVCVSVFLALNGIPCLNPLGLEQIMYQTNKISREKCLWWRMGAAKRLYLNIIMHLDLYASYSFNRSLRFLSLLNTIIICTLYNKVHLKVRIYGWLSYVIV